MSKKQGRLQGPGFPWVQVSRRSALPAALLCFNSKKCVWRATGTAHYLLSSIPTVHCGAAAWCWAAAGTDLSDWKEEGGVYLMSCCMAARTPDWAEGSQDNDSERDRVCDNTE